jgi:hypothetical protein
MKMSAKRYELLTASCLVAAVVSSFLYGKSAALNWAAIGLGVAAGLGAAFTYFYNSRNLDDSKVEQMAKPAILAHREVAEALLDTSIPRHVEFRVQKKFWGGQHEICALDPPRTGRYFAIYYKHVNAASSPIRLRERRLFLDEVVELVDRLSPTCEFELSMEGRITIRPKRALKAAAEEIPRLDVLPGAVDRVN